MDKKRIVIFGVVLLILSLLIYVQFRSWKTFDWVTFRNSTAHVRKANLLVGIGLTYLSYILRAVRWRILLKSTCKTTITRLIAPQFIGFSGLALLGTAGEMIRPFIIAKKERLRFASQFAVWGVERIFDIGAFALMLALSFLSPDLRALRFYRGLREGAFALIVLVFALIVGAVLTKRYGDRIGRFLYDLFVGVAPKFADHVRDKIRSFSEGLATIQDLPSALQLIALSILIWIPIVFAYYVITHAYGGKLATLTLPQQVVLMGSSVLGSMLQLPAVGGGQQVASVALLHWGFGIEQELAVSCGILIWAVTYMAVVPIGLLLAHREHLSIRSVAEAEQLERALAK